MFVKQQLFVQRLFRKINRTHAKELASLSNVLLRHYSAEGYIKKYHLVTRPFKGHQSKTVFLKCTQNTTMNAYSFNQNQFIANFNVLSTPLLLRTLQAYSTYILSISSLVSITTSTSSPIFFEKHVPLTHGRYCRHGKQRI